MLRNVDKYLLLFVKKKVESMEQNLLHFYLNLVKEETNINDEKIQSFTKQLDHYLDMLSKFTDWIKENIKDSKDDVSAACNDYLKVLGLVATAHAWIKVLEVSFKDYDNNKDFYEDKIQTANFYFNRVLPRAESHFKSAITGSKYIMDYKFN